MIAVNILVPIKEKEFIAGKVCETFQIIYESQSGLRRMHHALYVVKTTEEELLFLKLKYGSENIWRR